MFKSRLLQLVDLLVIFAFTAYVAIPQETEPRPSPAADLGRRSPGPVTPAPASQLARALGAFGQLQAGQPGATPADVAALTQKLGTAEEQGHSGFAEVERHLRAQALPRELLQRHRQAVDLHRARLADVRTRLADAEAEGDEDARRRKLEEAGRLLVGAPPRKGHDALDPARLPVRAASAKVRPPRTTPAELDADLEVVPATVARALTAAAAQAPTAADLAATEDVQLTPAVRELAASLSHNPVKIFNWVYNNVRYLPTYGSVQGSELTLTSKQGNAFDTASLLIALLRASGIAARYVQGTVDIPVEKVTSWLGGLPTAEAAQDLLGQGGVPNIGMILGGRITHLRIEHVWVEGFIDFEPSRGAVHRQGDTWVPMDAAFKQHQVRAPMDLQAHVSLDVDKVAGDTLAAAETDGDGAVKGLYPGFLKLKLGDYLARAQQALAAKFPDLNEGDLLGGAQVVRRSLSTLASGLPHKLVARGTPVAGLPASLRHAVTLRLYASALDQALDLPDLQHTVSLPALGGRRLGIEYAPASDADAQLIKSYAGAAALPVYLVRVIPRIEIDGEVVARGAVTTMGQAQIWDLSLRDPSGRGGGIDSYDVTAGDVIVVGIDGNGLTEEVVRQRRAAVPSNTVLENLHQVALHYWLEHDFMDRVAAAPRGVHQQRVPSAGMFSYPLGVQYFFGLPRSGSYSVELMDVKRVMSAVWAPSDRVRFEYMSQSGLHGSYLEGSVLDQLFNRFQGTSASTSQILLDAASAQIPIYTIDASNVATLLPKVSISADARAAIANATATGKRVMVPQRPPRDVSGYVIQDPETGAGAYMIEGGLSGGRGQKCRPQSQPEPVPIIEIVFKWLFIIFLALLLAMLLASIFGSGGASAPAAAPAAAAILAIIGGSLFLGAGNAYAGGRSACCTVNPVPHRGGDPVHNLCADLIGPNDHPGMDAQVDGLNFDAVTGDAMLWEVKTHNLANCTTDFCRDVLIPMWVAETQAQLITYSASAKFCGYLLAFGVGDATFAGLVGPGAYDVIQIRPDICLQP